MLFRCNIMLFRLRNASPIFHSSDIQRIAFLRINPEFGRRFALARKFFILARLEYGKKILIYAFGFHFASCSVCTH